METPSFIRNSNQTSSLGGVLGPGRWYFHVLLIHPNYRKYLRFCISRPGILVPSNASWVGKQPL
ncbi:hypothetical protein DPMN_025876 [Dreissena polymorpha]|uniref:Uncharacterized protein n=1 Tax=Dreissena polymorpha TaxID=45954 RepID=A0A9D4LU37_DREPO|nr:hypothetical protein DPMN_025876 [Dreissena polymorpha]